MLTKFLHKFYSLFTKRQSANHFENDNMLNLSDEQEIVLTWRKKIFIGIFTSFLVFISVPYFMSCRFVLQHKMWVSFTVYTFSYLSVFIIVIFRQIPFKIKVLVGLFVFYSLGMAAFVYAVAGGSAKIYLLSASIIATLLLGITSGIMTILINACTLIIVGYFVGNGTIPWIEGCPVVMKVYILTAATFMFLNIVLTISLAALVRALEEKLIESRKSTYKLKIANQELVQNQEKQKKLEEQLRQSENRFSTIFKHNPAPIALSRLSNSEMLEVNQAWLNLTEYSITEVIGQSIQNLNLWVDPAHREKFVENIKHKGIAQDEIRGISKSGALFEVLMSAEIIELNGEAFLLTMAQDITQRKQTEKALIESELQSKYTFEQAAVGICHAEPSGKLVKVNKRFCEIIGFPHDEILSYKWQEITHPDDLKRLDNRVGPR
jgi:PAS domain S-box-containing protein